MYVFMDTHGSSSPLLTGASTAQTSKPCASDSEALAFPLDIMIIDIDLFNLISNVCLGGSDSLNV